MKILLLSKIVLLTLILSFSLSCFSACKPDKPEPGSNTPPANLLDISGYSIIRADSFTNQHIQHINNQTANLQATIKDVIGPDLTVDIDADTNETEKEILIGKTNRAASQAALDKLTEKTSDEAYIIDITENKIAIVGTTESATLRALKVFINEYVKASPEGKGLSIDAGKTYAKKHDSSKVEFIEDDTELEIVQEATTVLATGGTLPSSSGVTAKVSSVHYPSIVELKYQPNKEDNGKLIAHFCLSATGINTGACFMQSTNGGKTWSLLAMPTEQKSTADNLIPGGMAHLYELPAKIGKYPAGTLVYASGSINYNVRTEIWVWYSTDCGKTWTQTSMVASGGSAQSVPGWGPQTGVWEPFIWYEDGYLYCFYSDDSDPAHDQKLVYKRSKDGVNWSKLYDVCTFDDPAARPGMFVMTKMGNGEYLMVYEYGGSPEVTGAPIYFKTTKDITNWNPSNPGTLIKTSSGSRPNSAPACIWTPYGGECGTLIVGSTSSESNLFVSFDYGKSWKTMRNPLPYRTRTDDEKNSRTGYSPSFVLGSDGKTIYYLNTTNIPETGKRRIQFTSFIIY